MMKSFIKSQVTKLDAVIDVAIDSKLLQEVFFGREARGVVAYEQACQRRDEGRETFEPLNQQERNHLWTKVIEDEWDLVERSIVSTAAFGARMLPAVTFSSAIIMIVGSVVAQLSPTNGLFVMMLSAVPPMTLCSALPFYLINTGPEGAREVCAVSKKMLAENMRPEGPIPGFFKARKTNAPAQL